jgi:tRNA (adenine57-N1/adenine58-N1)-methyltransferase
MIGRPYGSKQHAVNGAERYVHLLRPTAELWTRCLPHRTQIIYTPDCAFISEMLEVNLGSRVVESGTGSGSFTHFLSRAVGSTGHIYTFDFHTGRVEQARREFTEHGIVSNVTVSFRDVCNDGFGLDGVADCG